MKKLYAEFLGTLTLVMAIVGSGIMAQNLSHDVAVQLLMNGISTVLALGIAIKLFAKSSGAHFNPVVTLVALVNNRIRSSRALQFIAAQIAGACAGAILANLMFDFGAVNLSTKTRSGIGLLLGEVIATAGLIFVIEYLVSKEKTEIAPIIVPAWIGSAYFFTSSTSFANPAVTISRTLSDTFAGIAPSSVLGFFVAQVIGALVGLAAYRVYDSK